MWPRCLVAWLIRANDRVDLGPSRAHLAFLICLSLGLSLCFLLPLRYHVQHHSSLLIKSFFRLLRQLVLQEQVLPLVEVEGNWVFAEPLKSDIFVLRHHQWLIRPALGQIFHDLIMRHGWLLRLESSCRQSQFLDVLVALEWVVLRVALILLVLHLHALFYFFELLYARLSLRPVELIMLWLMEVAVDTSLLHVKYVVKNLEVHLISFEAFSHWKTTVAPMLRQHSLELILPLLQLQGATPRQIQRTLHWHLHFSLLYNPLY